MRRAGVIALPTFQALWLNVILPGHRRGAVTLPGYEPSAAQHRCCSQHPGSGTSDAPGDRAAHCAVCFFAARLSLPVFVDLTPAPLGLCGDCDVPACEAITSLDLQLTYLGRAPPVA